jgi:tripartite-type tricarboxylate transporter receptor subunit TctC
LAPGGTSDISARLIGQWLSERLGRQFITENKTGAAGSIAAEYVVNAAPDGYTLLVFASAAAINATLFTNLNFNFRRDIAPVASILRVPNVILVNPSFPAKTGPARRGLAGPHTVPWQNLRFPPVQRFAATAFP